MIGIRLQGGPFDGYREPIPIELQSECPERIYVAGRSGDLEWFDSAVSGAEVYRRDEVHDGWLIYLYTDEALDRHVSFTRSVLALDGAGA